MLGDYLVPVLEHILVVMRERCVRHSQSLQQ